MKIPLQPPAFAKLATLSNNWASLQTIEVPTHNGRYIHWDKLKRLKPSTTVSHEAWSFALKFRRTSLLKKLPLTDKSGRSVMYALPDAAIEYLHGLDRDAA